MANKCPICHSDNPNTLKFCGECGTQLPPPQDHPPVMTETLQTPVRELATGATFAGRYQIIEELGRGGMGRVYKVFDTKIKEKVALKLIKPEVASDKETIERFSNEIRLARRIRHKNVCGMFDIGEAEGAHFITMEYVHGEDLKSLIHMSGSLSLGMLLSVGKQVCDGLAEAHSLGVVHRDLKPQNIMIDKNGNAKIMDFGIARSIKDKGITGAGVMIGTPEYMSPEQADAKEVDNRSDIYSLGVILYEMATSHVPFTGETALSIAMKHKGEVPKNPKQLNPLIPDDLGGVILKCLEKDKAKRYQSASDVHSELEKIERGIPTTERVVPEIKPLTSREITLKLTPKRLLVPGFLFLVLIVAGIIWRVLPLKKPALSASSSGQPTLAVLYFENKSGDAKLDYLRDELAELINIDLSQSRFIRVVTSEGIYTILKRLGLADARKYSSEDIDKIAAQARASYVLRGSFIKAGEGFIITASLQKPGTTESSTPIRLEASNEKDIIVKVDDLARQVKEGLNLTPAQIASDIEKEAGKITTSSPEALKYYIEGRRLEERVDEEKSISYMEKAIAIDPEFAMAYRSLSMSHRYLGHEAEWRKLLKKAFDLSNRLPENERLLMEAMWLALGEEDYAKAIEVLERLLKIYPGHILGHLWLGVTYNFAGNIDKAIEHEEFVVQNEKTASEISNLASSYMAKGLYQMAEDLCRSFLKDIEDNGYIHLILGCSYIYRRQFDLAASESEKAYLLDPKLKAWMGTVLFCKDDLAGAEKILVDPDWQATFLLARGKINEMIGLSQQNLEKAKGDKEKERDAYGGLAGAFYKAGRYKDVDQAFSQYLKLSAECRKSAGESGLPYLPSQQKQEILSKGILLAEMKSFDEARKTAEELKSLIEKGINTKELRWYEYIRGLIELGKKDYRQAANLFSRACGRLNFECGVQEDSEQPLLFDNLARALYESGDLDKARKGYERITLLTTGRLGDGDLYAKAFYMLGKIAEQQGDKVRACENYRKFLDLWKDADPGLPEVTDAQKRLAGLTGN